MRLDTLNYSYPMKADKQKILAIILSEQEKYFQSKGLQGKLKLGSKVTTQVPSKMGTVTLPATIELSSLDEEHIELTTSHHNGTIIQTYVLQKNSNGQTKVTYSEKNSFTQTRNQYNFIFLALLYKFFYNRGVKRRMKYLESQC
jgi:hypothetical protein